jgi:hypothetical protein
VHDIESKGKNVTLIKIRNPWGTEGWKGDWSDRSTLWTQELRAKLKVQFQNDGIFYMKFEDFTHFYGDTTISYYSDIYYNSAARVKGN